MSDPALAQKLLQERKDGLSEAEIAAKYNLSTTEIRSLITIARIERHQSLAELVRELSEQQHHSNLSIAEAFDLTESEVRTLLLKGK